MILVTSNAKCAYSHYGNRIYGNGINVNEGMQILISNEMTSLIQSRNHLIEFKDLDFCQDNVSSSCKFEAYYSTTRSNKTLSITKGSWY